MAPRLLGGSKHGWRRVAARSVQKAVRDRVAMAAGSLAYHGFLALFPAIIAVLGAVALAHVGNGAVKDITRGIDKALPPGAAGVFVSAVEAASKRPQRSATALIVGIAVAIWSTSSAMAALQQALDMAYEVPFDRSFLGRRLHAVPLMAATLVLGGAGSALVLFGAPIGKAIGVEGGVLGAAWTAARWAATTLAITVLFSFFYFAGPNRAEPRWHWVSAGGIVATGVFLAASLGFSLYIDHFGSYGRTYGPFAGVAVLILWMWLTGLAVLLGGELNAEIERGTAGAPSLGALPNRPA
ncbi:MAG: YihY/virulence factor BrkB family protein [Acidimicrobiales bacterium]